MEERNRDTGRGSRATKCETSPFQNRIETDPSDELPVFLRSFSDRKGAAGTWQANQVRQFTHEKPTDSAECAEERLIPIPHVAARIRGRCLPHLHANGPFTAKCKNRHRLSGMVLQTPIRRMCLFQRRLGWRLVERVSSRNSTSGERGLRETDLRRRSVHYSY